MTALSSLEPWLTPLRALSVRQPWAWALAEGHKPVENRTWDTPFRGRFALHAGIARFELDEVDQVREAGKLWGVSVKSIMDQCCDPANRGAVLALADIVDCVRSDFAKQYPASKAWVNDSGFCFVIANVVRVPPVRVRGQLGFFALDAPTRKKLYEGGARW